MSRLASSLDTKCLSGLDAEFLFSEKVTKYVSSCRDNNFLQLMKLSLEPHIYNLLLNKLERITDTFISELSNKEIIFKKIDEIIEEGVVKKESIVGNIQYVSTISKAELNNDLQNRDVKIISKKYNGQWKDLKPEGKGYLILSNDDSYTGDFVNGQMHGQGQFKYKSGSCYIGKFERNKFHGEGEFTYSNGNKYKGKYHNDLREGYGVFTAKIGDCYEGDFKQDKQNGKGKMVFANGDIYEGDFQDGMPNGNGTYIYTKENRVEKGHFFNGKHYNPYEYQQIIKNHCRERPSRKICKEFEWIID